MEIEKQKKLSKIVEAAAKILEDYPELKYFEAIKKAKEKYKEWEI